jgi:hypothetical protein
VPVGWMPLNITFGSVGRGDDEEGGGEREEDEGVAKHELVIESERAL